MRLPETPVDAFGCFQNFLYTGKVYSRRDEAELPEYSLLLKVWKLAVSLKMSNLRVAVLDAMAERRQNDNKIPDTPLLIQAWQITEEGSGLRHMLIGWAAEHMRTSPSARNEFVKSLPHEILSELVITMSELPDTPAITPQNAATIPKRISDIVDLDDVAQPRSAKRPRLSGKEAGSPLNLQHRTPKKMGRPPKIRNSGPSPLLNNALNNNPAATESTVSTKEKDLLFCKSLITRMLTGPGFWTRFVKPFRHAVDPVADNVPNYFDVVKKPMDLETVERKINEGIYADASEFEVDFRLIFQNCYEYWTQDDPIWKMCEDFERLFNENWNGKDKWTSKNVKAELIDE